MTNLVGFDYRKKLYTLRRYSTVFFNRLSFPRATSQSVNIVEITPDAYLRAFLISGDSVTITLVGNVTESVVLTSAGTSETTTNRFSKIDQVVSNKRCAISLYSESPVNIELGQVYGAIYTDRRAIGTDEFNRITLVSTSVLVCLPGYEILSGDILVDADSNVHYSVIKAQQALDRRGKIHHWELDIVETKER